MTKLDIIDVTMRDGHQSLWSTRMTTAMMLPFARRLDGMGFFAIDLVGGAVFDVCVRYLKEDPWERMRIMSSVITRTPLNVMIRGASLFTFELFPADVIELTVQRIRANGIRTLMTYDALNDMRNLSASIRMAREVGLYVIGGVVYTESPVHTDQYFKEKARELKALGVDAVFLKDPSGLLTPERVKTLVPAIKEVLDPTPLQIHSHCLTGLCPLVYLEAIRQGVDVVQTAIRPLAYGASLPSTEFVARNARMMGRDVALNDDDLKDMADYFGALADQEGKPRGTPAEYDPFHYRHQVPGGMISNLKSQLEPLGLSHRLQEILEETARVREDLGYPILVSPFAQFVVTQAVLNVVQGERYKIIPNEVKKYCWGAYGELAAPVVADVMNKVGDPPTVDRSREAESRIKMTRQLRGPFDNDEDLLLSIFYEESQFRQLKQAGPITTEYVLGHTPLVTLIKGLMDIPRMKQFSLNCGDLKVSVKKGGM